MLGDGPLDVVDLGAGTGKLSEGLASAGHRTTAVEPLAEMRAILHGRIPSVRVVDGTAEKTGLPDASADAVVAGSAFHWFDHARALPEIVRILRVPGVLGVLGNTFDRSQTWVDSLREVLDGSRVGRAGHRPSVEELAQYFESVQEREFPHEETVDRDRLRDLALSRSGIAVLAPDERNALLERLDRLWVDEPELQGRDQARLRYLTPVLRCTGVRSRHTRAAAPHPSEP